MRPKDEELALELSEKLNSFHENQSPLNGILSLENRDCFIEQIIDSIRRIKYVTIIRDRTVTEHCIDALNVAFDPIKAASWHKRNGNIDEAFWLTFLATHFGKHISSKWGLVQGFYGALGKEASYWNWDRTINNIDELKIWLEDKEEDLKLSGSFGNHRKYQSRKANYEKGTIATISTYIDWVGQEGSHQIKIQSLTNENGNDPKRLFRAFYKSMNPVMGFGRTAIFDYLTMMGKLGLADIVPNSTYMQGATGPYHGAKLLFTDNINSNISRIELNRRLNLLEEHLKLNFGMQVLEDSICNWQKNPNQFQHFGG